MRIFCTFLKSYFNMRYLTVIILKLFFYFILTYGNIWLFELKNAYLFVLNLKIYLHSSHIVPVQSFNSKG